MTQGLSENRDSPHITPSLAAKTSGGRACLLLEAVRSIVHDIQNRLTGVSPCIGASPERAGPGSSARAANAAAVERGAGSLAALWKEFAGVEGAISFETAISPASEIVSWYVEFLERLGLHVNPPEADPSFYLATAARGVLSRALIQLAWGLCRLRASDITVSCRCGDGSGALTVAFRSMFSPAAAARTSAVTRARELVESGGGGLEFDLRDGRTQIRIVFGGHPPPWGL